MGENGRRVISTFHCPSYGVRGSFLKRKLSGSWISRDSSAVFCRRGVSFARYLCDVVVIESYCSGGLTGRFYWSRGGRVGAWLGGLSSVEVLVDIRCRGGVICMDFCVMLSS